MGNKNDRVYLPDQLMLGLASAVRVELEHLVAQCFQKHLLIGHLLRT